MYPGKRLFDITFSLVGVLVFSPVWLVTIGLIALLDGRPIFFTQRRLGLEKQGFTVYKFRTMTSDGEVTRTGKWLRATGIDESAQFLSVLKGDMSIVGPRPFTQSDLENLGWDSAWLHWRWSVKPGITGLAQVNERWATRQSLAWDRFYIARKSLMVDLRTLIVTFVMNVLGKERVRLVLHSRQARYIRAGC
jgi:lipopolysaccharide/colanic/teichoic acid biosynthesis glycosyltransferase